MTETIIDRIPWDDLVAVGIRTTADGPFHEDLFWQFWLGDRVVELPGTLIDDTGFSALGQHLPGIDWSKVAKANGSTEERIFSIWDRGSRQRAGDDTALRARFSALVARLGGRGSATGEAFDRLRAAWGAEQRRYHDLGHLAACLQELDGAPVAPATADIVELALWYHDAVYEPGARDCEQRSAQLLGRDAALLGLRDETARRAADLVRATAHIHAPAAGGDHTTDLMVDIDLSILGRDPLTFMDYEYSVEEEYAAMSGVAFRIARGRFLASLLASPAIFRTAYFRARYEQPARARIRSLLKSPRYRSYRWCRWLPMARS